MTTYLVFEPPGGIRTAEDADVTVFLPERFSWGAFVLTPFWLGWHGLWLGLAAWLAGVAILSGVFLLLGIDTDHFWIGALLPSAVVAFEASEIRRSKLLRIGYRETGPIHAADMEEAEQRYFASRGRAQVPSSADFAPVATDSVIGLFPEPGARP